MSISTNADAIAKRVAEWSKQVGPVLLRATLEAATVLTAAAKREAPVGTTGRLRRSISYQAGGAGRYVVAPNTPYAVAVHTGTRPHIIRPTRKKALFWKGGRHPVKLVRHPGTRANRYMTRAHEAARSRVAQIAREAGHTIITRQG